MPTYTYDCLDCKSSFELFSYIKDYQEYPKCINCGSKKTNRSYVSDVSTQSSCIKKSDSELKTLGDLAKRNSDRFSNDEKAYLYHKHNSYKQEQSDKKLPAGMSRIEKPQKLKWPGSKNKSKRKPKK